MSTETEMLYVTGLHRVPTRTGLMVYVLDCTCGWKSHALLERQARRAIERHADRHAEPRG
jgi:hypothetical protein